MNCKEFNHIIDKIIEQDLTEKEEHLYKEHVARCLNCKKELAELLEINSRLQELDKLDPPSNFTSQVVNRAHKEGLFTKKPKAVSMLSKLSMAVASFLLLFLLLDYTVLPFYSQRNLDDTPDFGIQNYQTQDEILDNESKEMKMESEESLYRIASTLDEPTQERNLRNTIVLVIAGLLSAPFAIEFYKRKKKY